jgi:hypothetical protein
VNLDPFHTHHGWVQVPTREWLLEETGYRVDDLLTGERYHWHGEWNYVRLDPGFRQAHILRVESPAAGAHPRPSERDITTRFVSDLQRLTT